MAMVTSPLYPNGCDENFYTRKSGRAKANFSTLRQNRIYGSIDHVFDFSLNIVLTAPCFVRKGADSNET
jgi:hypothetical protein